MAIKRKESKAEESIIYNVTVKSVKECKNGSIMLNIVVNGVAVNGCFYKSGTKNGKDWSLIQFPQERGQNDKYFNRVWFPISKELMEDIEKQIESML